MDRIVRNIKNRKLDKSKILNRVPNKSEFKVGVPIYALVSGVLFEYIKIKNVLYKKAYDKV